MKRALLLFVAACSSSAPPPKPPAPPPSNCARVADHFLELMTPEAQGAPTEQLDETRRLFNDHCKNDGWSSKAQDCMLAAKTLQDIGEHCQSLLTPEQNAALVPPAS
ncbi:MAG TPA: hypothetical protein VL326_16760 [Kofleriaceae bacterium]|jgi:hypothetical protein|nr:hypothetical protein [Kofleriaceae bacterium]